MLRTPYLVRLGNRLADGLSGTSPDWRARHAEFVLSFQQDDGGFAGREGDSDLYYTSFAVRALVMLGQMSEGVTNSVAEFLARHDPLRLGVIDLMNWLSTALAVQVATGQDLLEGFGADFADVVSARLEEVRTKDGGYAKSVEGSSGSTYHSFLVLLTYQLLGKEVPRPNALIQFLYDRQRDDGGFVEIAPMRRSGTNPTAAAVAILQELNAVDDEIRADVRAFLKDVRGDEGGFQANSRVPFTDSLSTFTGLLTIQDLGLAEVLNPQQLRELLESQLEFPTGGYRAATWDEAADVEYTFYGLGVKALLGEEAPAGEETANLT
ncbi:Prenyltransferase and squalene oxidase repeat protein [Thalassoglobus neptunius]|uniref:Geranylgeranyl transferase type II subunit beta n=1 Tax=Thalassoglobus neptunius TaxID=1938619 RepID=A0A5C5X5W3_9PLAN|nr:prenyltransferase/squalene oxidase repeat-containing protein [Thalassoglobus neptunius]TWT58507.1 Prenyltransferase and squalene oxidase repeat protein [Thalassoglobus neptunius]